MGKYPVNKIYRQIEPGPVLLLRTQDNGVPNAMAVGFQMMANHDPALIGLVVGPWDRSYEAFIK